MAELGTARFASSVRSSRFGAGAAMAPDGVPRLVVEVALTVTGTTRSGAAESQDAGARLELIGPGDVVGIAPAEVLRVFPNAGEHAAEPNYLASIEFDSPELPWLVSLSAGEPVQPWIALVVVPDSPGCVGDESGSLLPWLNADSAQLPPPSELWAWAHAHATGDASLETPAPGDGRATLSRLLCPTRLQPSTAYVAAVVPTYLAGVMAARRQNPGEAGDRPSWTEGQGAVQLPIYHHWRFVTGVAGDFEELARDLTPVDASDIEGLGRIDLRLGKGGLAGVDPQDLNPVRTLLVSPEEDAASDAQAAVLQGEVPDTIEEAVNATAADADRVVRPPRYGQWPAGDAPVRGGPDWYAELNLQPDRRIVARLGADLVRTQQEELVAEARRQLGEYREARRIRDLLRLGEMTATRLHERSVVQAPDERVLPMARPALPALVAGEGAAVIETMAADGFGMSLLAGSFDRIAQRISARTGVPAARLRSEFVAGSMTGDLVALPAPQTRPPLDIGRMTTALERAGVLEQQVEGVTVGQLLALAPPAALAQDQLVTELADARFDVQEVAVPRAPADQPPADGGAIEHAVGGVDRLRIPAEQEVLLQQAPAFQHLRPAIREAVVAEQLQVHAFDVAAAQAVRVPLELPADIADLRIDHAARDQVTVAVTDATTDLMQVALAQGLPAAAVTFTDLVVDRDTVDLAVALQGADASVLQLDVRDSVRRNLGLQVFGPVLRDQLTAEGRRQFDAVVTTLGERQVSDALRYPAAPPRVTVAEVAAPVRSGLRAEVSYTAASAALLPWAVGLVPSLVPMGFVPTFNAPLADRLQRALNQWVLAGADRVPPNSISVVMTNPAFIEAFTAGANHEMARELLWRDVPSDARGTVFSRFWNTPLDAADKRLTPVHLWRRSLGKNLGTGSPYLCVLVRSPLLRRYPNAVVHAAQGQILETPDGKNFEPDPTTFRTLLFQGAISPDITFSVVDLTEAEVRTAPAEKPWYLLLGEPVSEPKFGLDVEPETAGRTLTSWQDLAWTDASDGPVLRVGDAKLTARAHDGVAWGSDAAAMARILHQDPFRLVLPALDFLRLEA